MDRIRGVIAALLLASLLAPAAHASTAQESLIQDDPLLLNARSQSEVDQIFRTFKSIGVDRVRVSLFWDHVAPRRLSQRRPSFPSPGPSWPGSYPKGSWARYDRIVIGADRAGVGLLFTVTGPAPEWATPGKRPPYGVRRPSPREFGAFVKAAGIRYSGAYPIEGDPPAPDRRTPITIGGLPLVGSNPPPADPGNLPRVDHWSIWNEPNYPQWLLPIWLDNRPKRRSQMVAAAPHQYRHLVDAAWSGLSASGHGGDTILIGETAPRGGKKPSQLGNAMPPAEFVRELYCLQRNFRPYTGRAAQLRGCPATAKERQGFRAAHPALFRAQGYALHPYSLDKRRWRLPTWRHPIRDNVSISNLGYMTRTLDRAIFFWGASREPMSLWITEYGYQTSPPDPFTGVSLARQGPLSSWGEYVAYRNPRVASIAQFLLVDDVPIPGRPVDSRKAWISWQSGLLTADRRPKPALAEYQVPVHVAKRGRSLQVFSGWRAAPNGAELGARIEFAAEGGTFVKVKDRAVSSANGFFSASIPRRGRGHVRVVWFDATNGRSTVSRSVAVD